MSDITLTVVAGPTVELTADAPGAVTVTVSSGGGGGVTDHGALTGLADDDHPQYVRGSLVDAAGDLLVGSAADTLARLPLGSASQVLRVNAGATAPEWAAASAGALSVIARTVLADDNSSSVDFTSIPSTYESLMVTWQARSTSSASWTVLWCRFNNDSTANYEYGYSRSTGGSVAATGATGQTGAYVGLLVDNGGTTGFGSYGSLVVPGYARTVFNKGLVGTASAQYGAGAGKASVGDYSATWINTAAVNRITFYPNSLNFVAGTVFTLYGIAGS